MTAIPSPLPKYLYKLLPSSASPPTPLPTALPLSALDEKDGYIHLSTSIQTPDTAGRYFGGEPKIYLLKIEYATVVKDIKWEDAGSGTFAHLYNGGKLGKDEVFDVKGWEKGETGWKEVLEQDAWLEY